LGQDERAVKKGDGSLHHAISTRKEGKWESSVFKGPTENVSMRKRLSRKALERADFTETLKDQALGKRKNTLLPS